MSTRDADAPAVPAPGAPPASAPAPAVSAPAPAAVPEPRRPRGRRRPPPASPPASAPPMRRRRRRRRARRARRASAPRCCVTRARTRRTWRPSAAGGAAAGGTGASSPARRARVVAAPEPKREVPAERLAKNAPIAGLTRPGEDAAQRAAPSPPAAAAPAPGHGASRVEGFAARRDQRVPPAHVEPAGDADRASAEREIRAVVARLGGVVTSAPESLDALVVPGRPLGRAARELGRLGTLRVDRRRPSGPPAAPGHRSASSAEPLPAPGTSRPPSCLTGQDVESDARRTS